MHDWSTNNLLAWMEQAFVLASLGSTLLVLFRVRHPWTKLAYCHALLAVCLVLPWLQPWRAAGPSPSAAFTISVTQARWVLWLVVAGGAAKLAWLLAGLWRIRKCRISSMPLYPIPESVRAASAVTQADALFCISGDVPGPVMLGWLAPVVLMPETFLSLGEDAQCGVACHELLHVRRHDWLVTVLEELTGAVLWFNPAICPLLAQTRLAREQLVDAEVVRLTAAREPYIDALLAIARGGSALDLAPAPLFLRRRHLTQRVHSLLKDGATSPARLISSYAAITAILAGAGWFGLSAFPMIGRAATPVSVSASLGIESAGPAPPQATPAAPAPAPQPAASGIEPPSYIPSAPIPQDPRELAVGAIQVLSPDAEALARMRLNQARRNARLTAADTPPYRLEAAFTADANPAQTGRLMEIGTAGLRRWTADLGGFSVTRWTGGGRTVEDRHSSTIPSLIQTLREAIHWADRNLPNRTRSAAVEWNGRPATCLLLSNMSGEAALTQARLWEEDEYCLDDSSGQLQIASIAPGVYTVYGYAENLQFHGRPLADRITFYSGGTVTADARLSISDMSAEDQALLTPQPGQAADGLVVTLRNHARFPIEAHNPLPSKVVQPVIVHAQIDSEGRATEAELCAASDPALAEAALDLVKRSIFRHQPWSQYQAYINVRFLPSAAK